MATSRDANRSRSTTSNGKTESQENPAASTAQVSHRASTAATRRRPQQERARFTVAAILEAAADVIDNVGWSRASTNRIAERAGVSIGSLYQYFPNKEAILASLYDSHHHDIHAVVARNLEEIASAKVGIADGIRGLFEDLIRLHREDPVLSRVLSTAVPVVQATHGPQTPGHDHEALVHLLAARPDVQVADFATAARIIEITIGALTRWMVHEAPESTDLETYVDECVAMVAGYLKPQGADET